MRCLVTGVAGFVGSSLAEALVAKGHEVRGVDCFTDYYARADKERNLSRLGSEPGFTLKEVDLGVAEIPPLLEGVEVVFHQAAQAGVRKSWGQTFESYTHHNVLSTQRLLEASRACKTLRRFVYASSSSVYGQTEDLPMRETSHPRPFSPYGVTKLAAEHLCELYRNNFGLPATSLRYFTVYGPRQRPDMAFHRFIEATLAGKPIEVYGDGEQTRDFTFIEDIVAANIAAGEGDASGVFNVGGGSSVTLNHVLETLTEVMGQAPKIDRKGDQAGDVRHTFADSSAIHRALGFKPKVALKDGLTAQVAWHRERRG